MLSILVYNWTHKRSLEKMLTLFVTSIPTPHGKLRSQGKREEFPLVIVLKLQKERSGTKI